MQFGWNGVDFRVFEFFLAALLEAYCGFLLTSFKCSIKHQFISELEKDKAQVPFFSFIGYYRHTVTLNGADEPQRVQGCHQGGERGRQRALRAGIKKFAKRLKSIEAISMANIVD
ncbi:hypothetical protein GALMADRAFT_578584 [Galerina marginata CBS 339.88]|uniref:Uncharacterized protein n=1 Tax=Galerina marginata (strain CBS 339.88) TaxID=685588 RepID=A0A067SW91_GALM3|nr:hypothetical protein GALMADRAFT_578584 [Galerina marginata CBS 339.88]